MANYVREEDMERFKVLALSMRSYDISGRLKDIKCPVLVMGGAEDQILHEGALKEIADSADGELHVYEEYGHAVYDEAKDFITRIHMFFKKEEFRKEDFCGQGHPKVSIIVPVYNGEKVVSKCINSVLNQEFKDWELILINDGSKDNTAALLDEYALHDDRIRVIHKPNGGVSSTRNRGLSEAKGDYIQFMDADDWLTEDSTKVLVRTLEEGEADMAVADFYRVVGDLLSRKGSILSNDVLTVKEYAEWMKESPADYYYGVLWNKLYKRSIIEQYKLRMDESVSLCEDYLFNLEYLLHCEKVAPVQIPVYYYLKTEGSLVTSSLNLKKIVNMKTSVFDYYDKFYRSVFDEEEYEKNRVEIAKFLVSAATDDGALPFLPGTKKLGEEKIQVHYEAGHSTNIVETTYFLTKVFDKYMNSVAMKYDLDIKDLRIFYVIMRVGPIHDQKQITDFTGIPLASVLLSLEKLISRGLIRVTIELPEYEAELTEKAADIVKDLDNAVKDMEELCFSGFSEEDAESVRNAVRRITDTLRDSLTR
ncbi:MAG: glycosyltransferase [Erysipelotrichales bacterium]|nr:glycosyltransferase [Erysipelotrichales bacterium]